MRDDLLDTPEGRWFADRICKAEAALLANSRAVQLHDVVASLGLGHLPCYLAATAPGLIRLDAGLSVTREIWIGVHRDTRHAPRIVAVQDALVSAIAHDKALLSPASDSAAPSQRSKGPEHE